MTDSPATILFCIDRFGDTGGTEIQLGGLIERLDRTRFDPHLCVLGLDPGDTTPANCGSLVLDVRSLGRPGTLRQAAILRNYLRRHRVRIVHSFFQDATIFSLPVARLAGVPGRLISFRDLGFWRTPRTEFLMRRTYPLATGFLANSEAVREVVCSRDALRREDIVVIPNGMDTAGIRFRDEEASPPTVVFVGNLNRRVKRPELFLEAAAALAPRFPAVRWSCIGAGRHRAELEERARELGLGESFAFLGRRTDVPALLESASIGVNCSDSEGLANAVLEYMLAGAAVVATDVGGNRELIEHDRTGLLVPTGDASALADAIARLLASPELADGLRRRARTVAEQNHGWDHCLERHQEFYSRQLRARI